MGTERWLPGEPACRVEQGGQEREGFVCGHSVGSTFFYLLLKDKVSALVLAAGQEV